MLSNLDYGQTMTLDELNKQFDDKCVLVMSQYMTGKLDFEEYDIEMTVLGEWYDGMRMEIQDRAVGKEEIHE